MTLILLFRDALPSKNNGTVGIVALSGTCKDGEDKLVVPLKLADRLVFVLSEAFGTWSQGAQFIVHHGDCHLGQVSLGSSDFVDIG